MDISEPIYLAIQITDDHAETLEIQPDDDVEETIDEFCERNGLDDDQKKAIFETVLAYLEQVSNSQGNTISEQENHNKRNHKRSDSYSSNLYASEPPRQQYNNKHNSKFPARNENSRPQLDVQNVYDAYSPKLDNRPGRDSHNKRRPLGNNKNKFYDKLKQESTKNLNTTGWGYDKESSKLADFYQPPQMFKHSSKKFPPINSNESDENIRKQLSDINQKISQENVELERHFDLDVNTHVKASDPGHNNADIELLNDNLEQRLMGNVR